MHSAEDIIMQIKQQSRLPEKQDAKKKLEKEWYKIDFIFPSQSREKNNGNKEKEIRLWREILLYCMSHIRKKAKEKVKEKRENKIVHHFFNMQRNHFFILPPFSKQNVFYNFQACQYTLRIQEISYNCQEALSGQVWDRTKEAQAKCLGPVHCYKEAYTTTNEAPN
jgi:hypothetical protein